MAIKGMNHFNVLTDNVDTTRKFYIGVLGLREGSRPPFAFDGAWLYAGAEPILHVSAGKLPADPAGVLDHIAFNATDLQATIARLNEHRVPFDLRRQTGTGVWQIFCHDPMGAKVELDFDPSEIAP